MPKVAIDIPDDLYKKIEEEVNLVFLKIYLMQ